MTSAKPGGSGSGVELAEVGLYDFTVRVDGRRLRMTYYRFPWFVQATRGQMASIERPAPDRLHWPELDVDLCIESIEHPERYPLVSGYRDRV